MPEIDFDATPAATNATVALFYDDMQLTEWEPYQAGKRINVPQPMAVTHVIIRCEDGTRIPIVFSYGYTSRDVDAHACVILPKPCLVTIRAA